MSINLEMASTPSSNTITYTLVKKGLFLKKCIGFAEAKIYDTQKIADLTWFRVEDKYRRRGYGRMLINALAAEIRNRNLSQDKNGVATECLKVHPCSDQYDPATTYKIYEGIGFRFREADPDREHVGCDMYFDI